MSGGTGAVSAPCDGVRNDVTELDSGAGTARHSWPMRSHLELAALPTAPACARGHVRVVAHEWGLPQAAETAELLASELITNAVQASARLPLTEPAVIRLWLVSDGLSVVIHVWDASHEMPARRDAGLDEDNGRGLMLVEALGKQWGAYGRAGGKVVWVVI
jgi:anti-sigma regulatory factor (Ser/Thr protein kinase)